MEEIFVNGSHLIEYADARAGNAFLTNGTCSYALADSDGNAVSSGDMPHITARPGMYRTTIPATDLAGLTPGGEYVLTISFSTTDGYSDERTVSYLAARRGRN